MSITTEELKRMISYDESTGIFRWIEKRRGRNYGGVAGSIHKTLGYLQVRISYKLYYGHRLAWQYVHGYEPTERIDHIDGNPSNNMLSNLRMCSQSQNMGNSRKRSNNTSGFKGVSWFKRDGKWKVQIQCAGMKNKHIGYYYSPEIAAIVYDITALEMFGQFAKTNF